LGLDGCNGVVGWYVDEVDVYYCDNGSDPCGDGFCDSGAGEDCVTCAADCEIETSGAVCGNGICEAADGEDCVTCAADCNGLQKGKPSNRFCCGFGGEAPNGCGATACTEGGYQCTETPAGGGGSYCCAAQEVCGSGIDDDCDGAIDCADTECASDQLCQEPPPADCSGYDNRNDCRADNLCRWHKPTAMCLPK
jgi:hypothetical protein